MRDCRALAAITVGGVLAFMGCGKHETRPLSVVRMGYFTNITHAQALIGVSRGDFQKALGNLKLETMVFNAGPSVVEAMFAGRLDCSFIGPSPAINGYVKSGGKAFKIVCGAAANGVVIVARPGSGIEKLEDLAGKRIATPQFGNTQDISARVYISKKLGCSIGEAAGQTRIIPIPNAEQLEVFKKGDIDASWVPEPWGARCVNDAGAQIIAEEKDLWSDTMFATTVFIVSEDFLNNHPYQVEMLVRTLVDITEWINANKAEAAALVNDQLRSITGKSLRPEILSEAFSRVTFTNDPLPASVSTCARWAFEAGMMKETPDVSAIVDSRFIDRILNGSVK